MPKENKRDKTSKILTTLNTYDQMSFHTVLRLLINTFLNPLFSHPRVNTSTPAATKNNPIVTNVAVVKIEVKCAASKNRFKKYPGSDNKKANLLR